MEPPSSPYPSFPPSQPDDDEFDPSLSPSPEVGSPVEPTGTPPDINLPDQDATPPPPPPPTEPHPALPQHPPPPPVKINLKVQTASALLDDRIAFEHRKNRRPISTGCVEIDKQVLLTGGFQRGEVMGLSGEGEEVGVLVRTLPFPSYSGWH